MPHLSKLTTYLLRVNMLNEYAATWVAIGGVVGAYGNFGPDGTSADVVTIATAPNVSGATVANYDNVQGLTLLQFAADDCDAAKSQIPELWRVATVKARYLWATVRSDDFPESRFAKIGKTVSKMDCDTVIMTIVAAVINSWGS